MTGWIYRIYDTRNGVSYIGQTTDIKKRVRNHIYSISKSAYNSKVYRYLRSIPKEFIGFEIICECDRNELDALEAHYIQVYNAYDGGLNTASIGSVFRNTRVKDIYDKVYKLWLSGKSYTEISGETKLSVTYISEMISSMRKPGDQPDKKPSAITNKAKPIVCYDTRYNYLHKFKSTLDAIEFLKEKFNRELSQYTAYVHLKQSCQNGSIAYGFRWQYESDLYYENKVFNTRWDIEAYKKGGAVIKNQNGLFECLNDKVETIRNSGSTGCLCYSPIRTCKICGAILSKKSVGDLCSKCIDHNSYQNRQVPPDLKISYPFVKEELQQLYPKYTVNSIAKHCKVSYTTVNKWIKRFGLK